MDGLPQPNGTPRDKMPRIEMGGCKNLKVLCMMHIASSDWRFHDFIAQFPLLQELILVNCGTIERLTISSTSLERLQLIWRERLLEAKIEAPNLVSFRYSGDLLTCISSTDGCGAWETSLTAGVNTAWFLRSREFLLMSKHFKVVAILIDFDKVDDLHELSAISTPASFEIEHLKLRVLQLSSNYPAVLDALLWSCRPRELTLGVSYDLTDSPQYGTSFIEYIYKKLKHIGHICCRCCANNAEIEISEGGLSNWRPTELSVLLNVLPTMVPEKCPQIHFRIS